MDQKNKLDPRVIRTRQVFKQVFVDLIMQKGYRSVTVTDIVGASGYNRATFYAHFKDKEDLKEIMIQEAIDGLEASLHQPFEKSGYLKFETMHPASVKVFQYVYEHSKFFDLLKEYEPIPGLTDKIIEMIQHVFLRKIKFIDSRDLDINTAVFTTYRTYGIFGLILEWIKSDYKETPIAMSEQLIAVFNAHSPVAQINGG